MTIRQGNRGGAPVGLVTELDTIEAGAVLYLRLWCESAVTQKQVQHDFSCTLGTENARRACESLDQLCTLCARHGRRPIMRRSVTCRCLGADESCFANFIGAASSGARDDAFLLASLMVRPDFAPCLVGLAETFGLALRQMALSADPTYSGATHVPNSPNLH